MPIYTTGKLLYYTILRLGIELPSIPSAGFDSHRISSLLVLGMLLVGVALWRARALLSGGLTGLGWMLTDPVHEHPGQPGPGDGVGSGERPESGLLERRVDVMETLGRLMIEVRDSADVREQIVVAFVDALYCQWGSLWELAPEGGYYVARAEVHRPDDQAGSVVGRQTTLAGNELLARLIVTSKAMPVSPGQAEMLTDLLGERAGVGEPQQPTLLVPLQHYSQLLGFLLLQDSRPQRRFDDADVTVADAAATYSALVLENLRNRIAEQERGERMSALARLSATLTTRHSLNEVLPDIVLHGAALARSATCTVLLVENDQTLRLAAQVGLEETEETIHLPLSNPVIADFILRDVPLIVEDIDRDRPEMRQVLVRDDLRSIQVFPLRVANSVIGALTLGYLHPNRPERSEINIGETLAGVAAGAIQNARAFELEAEQRDQLRTVAEISRRVSGILDTEWMLQEVCNLLSRELGYDYVHIFLVDEMDAELIYAAGSGALGQQIRDMEHRLDISGQWLAGQAVLSNAPRRAGSAGAETFKPPQATLVDVASEIAVPIVAHNHAIGVLVAQSESSHAFNADDERLLKIVTDQVSVALDNARHHAEVQSQARLDSLTQVLNHGAFVAALHRMAEQATVEEENLTLIMLDVDYFKEYNDRFGHVAGDAALKTLVQAIRAHVKSRDAVGRWGGEEFGIALLGADKPQAEGVAERIRETLASLVPVDRLGREMPAPSVSQGIAMLGEDARGPDELVDIADQALYRAKDGGRDQVRLAGDAA
ncbi:MAG: diguanylate cyclase [Anaerolineales bacterium]